MSAEAANAAVGLLRRYEATGAVADIEQAVRISRGLVADTSATGVLETAQRRVLLANLAYMLTRLFEATRDGELLAEAEEAGREAVALSEPDDPTNGALYTNLALVLHRRHTHSGRLAALAEAAEWQTKALSGVDRSHPEYRKWQSNLGATLRELYESTASADALKRAIEACRSATTGADPRHPLFSHWQANLGMALMRDYAQSGDSSLLTQAVTAGHAAYEAAARGGPRSPDLPLMLSDLAALLDQSYQRTNDPAELAQVVEVLRHAALVVPRGHAAYSAVQNNLAVALLRSATAAAGADGFTPLLTAIGHARKALRRLGPDDPHRPELLGTMSCAHLVLSGFRGFGSVLIRAERDARAALDATPQDHPDRAVHLNRLAEVRYAQYRRYGEPALLLTARDLAAEAGRHPAGQLLVRVGALRRAAEHSGTASRGADRLALLEEAIELAQRLAPRTLDRIDREHRLGLVSGLATEAAQACMGHGGVARAVELLEHSRGLLAADVLDARSTDLAALRAAHPGLADQVVALRTRWERLDRPGPHRADLDGARDDTADPAQQARRLAARRAAADAAWTELVARIRTLPGFDEFMRPPNLVRLAARLPNEPVVYVYAGSERSDAVIVRGTRGPGDPPAWVVHCLPLPGLSAQGARAQVELVRTALAGVQADDADTVRAAHGSLQAVLAWLWDVVGQPVISALGYDRPTTDPAGPAELPRMWWCPVGILGELPLHAAGRDRALLDYAVPSYTATLRALADAYARPVPQSRATLVVGAHDLPGHGRLPAAEQEISTLVQLVPQATVLAAPTARQVCEAVLGHPVVHFACHGRADRADPAGGRLVLADQDTDPLTVATISTLRLNGRLAVLPACETSASGPVLADESVHFSAAFQLAGYRGVVGTMWSVPDEASGRLTAEFYRALTSGGTVPPDTERAARALHTAVCRLRHRYQRSPIAWAGYVHVGI